MTLNKTQIEALIAPLREKYRAQLTLWLAEMEPLSLYPASHTYSQAEIALLRRHAHALCGSGATYGFHAITETARELETQMIEYDPARNADSAAASLRALLVACRSVV